MDNNEKMKTLYQSPANPATIFFCEELTEAYVNGDSNAVNDARKMLADHIKTLTDSELIELAKYATNKIGGYEKIITTIFANWEERFKT